jgi:hypothetical protein
MDMLTSVRTISTRVLITMLVLAGASPGWAAQRLEIGAKLDDSIFRSAKIERCITRPSVVESCIDFTQDGTRYTLAFDAKHLITYIHTEDPNFANCEGLKVGGFLDVKGEELRAYSGWEVRSPARKDGWYPVVGYDQLVELPGGLKLLYSSTDEKRRTVVIAGFSKSAAERKR